MQVNPFYGRKIQIIELIFENYESYKVPITGIASFDMFDLKYSISYLPREDNYGEVDACCYCNSVVIVFNKSGRRMMGEINPGILLDKAIHENSVSQVNIQFEDGANIVVSVPWVEGKDKKTNSLQKIIVDQDYLYLKISGYEGDE